MFATRLRGPAMSFWGYDDILSASTASGYAHGCGIRCRPHAPYLIDPTEFPGTINGSLNMPIGY
jgi:hypothetical protein